MRGASFRFASWAFTVLSLGCATTVSPVEGTADDAATDDTSGDVSSVDAPSDSSDSGAPTDTTTPTDSIAPTDTFVAADSVVSTDSRPIDSAPVDSGPIDSGTVDSGTVDVDACTVNACLGCATLDNPPDSPCGGACDSATYQCSGTNATICVDPVTTPAPGTACGSCGTLKYTCSTDGKTTSCPGDDKNACGGCTKLSRSLGDPCCSGAGSLVCNGTNALRCSVTCAEKRVFVSSALFTANLGGLDGADSQCQKLADAASLGGRYKAWLSTDSVSASARLSHATVPYVLVNGTTVANNWSELATYPIRHAIDTTEKNTPAVATPTHYPHCSNRYAVWTGTEPNGTSVKFSNCTNWSSTAPAQVTVGGAAYNNNYWSDGCTESSLDATCDEPAALYCIEQ